MDQGREAERREVIHLIGAGREKEGGLLWDSLKSVGLDLEESCVSAVKTHTLQCQLSPEGVMWESEEGVYRRGTVM